MIRGDTLPEGEPIYTWVADDGSNVHIASGRLYKWVMSRDLEVQMAPTDKEMAQQFVRDNIISPARVLQLQLEVLEGKRQLDPIILCKRGTYTNGGPDVFLVDGHHRFVLAALSGMKLIPCFLLEVNQWRRFQIVGLPALTQEQLNAIPVKRRNY